MQCTWFGSRAPAAPATHSGRMNNREQYQQDDPEQLCDDDAKYPDYSELADEALILEGRRLHADLEKMWRAELALPNPNGTTLWLAFELMALVEEGLCRLRLAQQGGAPE